MIPWDTLAATILAAAADAALSSPLDRSYLAQGPDFARNCRQVAVYLDAPTLAPLSGEYPRGFCPLVPVVTFQVVFTADCSPMPDGKTLPDPDLVSAWSALFMADCQAIHEALTEAVMDGSVGDGREATVEQGVPSGPSGGRASMRFPVRVRITS